MKSKLYIIAEIIFCIMSLGTLGAVDRGAITFGDACWQIIIYVLAGLWFWKLIRIEDARYSRRIIK